MVRALARAVCKKKLTFEASKSLDETISRLSAVQGIAQPTAQYIAMRVFAEPDAFPSMAPELRRILNDTEGPASSAQTMRRIESWRPWRAYAAMHLCAARVDTKKRHPASKLGR